MKSTLSASKRADGRPVTMADVASVANVHQTTVSRVLNRPDAVSAATRERVVDAIEMLGYVPHSGARQMAGGRTGVIAVLVPDLANPYFAGLLKAIQRAGTATGSNMMVADTDLDPEVETGLVRTFAQNVDAIVVCSPVAPTAKLRAAAGERVLVFVNRSASSVDSVTVDQAEIVRASVAHLRDLGHRRIALASGPDQYWSAGQRRRVVETDPNVIVLEGLQPTYQGGFDALAAVLSAEVTAIVAFNDQMALGLLAAARARGLAVPGEFSVVGSDDILFAAMSTPALTTIAAPLDELGSTAVGLVQSALAGSAHRSGITLPVTLVERDSTAPPATKKPPR